MIASTLVKLVLFLILSGIVKFFWKHRRYYYLALKIPTCPDHLPILGISYKFLGTDAKGLELCFLLLCINKCQSSEIISRK